MRSHNPSAGYYWYIPGCSVSIYAQSILGCVAFTQHTKNVRQAEHAEPQGSVCSSAECSKATATSSCPTPCTHALMATPSVNTKLQRLDAAATGSQSPPSRPQASYMLA